MNWRWVFTTEINRLNCTESHGVDQMESTLHGRGNIFSIAMSFQLNFFLFFCCRGNAAVHRNVTTNTEMLIPPEVFASPQVLSSQECFLLAATYISSLFWHEVVYRSNQTASQPFVPSHISTTKTVFNWGGDLTTFCGASETYPNVLFL